MEAASSQSAEGPLYFKDAWMMQEGIKRKLIPKDLTALAVQKAVAINAWNSLNGKVVATPTGGSCGFCRVFCLRRRNNGTAVMKKLPLPCLQVEELEFLLH